MKSCSCLSELRLARLAGAALLLAAMGSTAVLAAPPHKLKPLPGLTPAPEAKAWKGEREITVDRATGRRRLPTQDEATTLAASLRAMLNRSSEGLSVVERPDGVRQVNLQGRFASVILSRPGAGATSEVRCVTTFEEAVAFLGLTPVDGGAGSGASDQ